MRHIGGCPLFMMMASTFNSDQSLASLNPQHWNCTGKKGRMKHHHTHKTALVTHSILEEVDDRVFIT